MARETKDETAAGDGRPSTFPEPDSAIHPDAAPRACAAPRSVAPRQVWADMIRVLAVLMIFLFHFAKDWAENTATPLIVAEQFIRSHFAGWAIAAFVVLSGFSLALTLSVSRDSAGVYFSHRLARILAPYWTVVLPFALVGFAVGEAPLSDLWKLPVWLTGLGPVNRATYQPISEAWWYVSLALQISLVLPVLVRVRRAFGLLPLTVIALAVNTAALVAVAAAGSQWSYLAQGLVVCRLTEVMIGVAAAELVLANRGDRRRLATALASIALIAAASPLLDQQLHLWTGWGATVALGVLFAICALFAASFATRWRPLAWATALSYCFYLTHAPVGKYSGRLLAKLGLHITLAALPLILVVCVLVAWVADWVARRFVAPPVSSLLRRLLTRGAKN